MLGPYFPTFSSRPVRALNFSRPSQHDLSHVSMEFLLFGTMLEPCWDHVGQFWPDVIPRPAGGLEFPILSQHDLNHMFMEFLFLTMLRLFLAQQFFQIKWSSKIFNTELK